jgi:formamidopyrimidine-DNA glycosylase
MRRFLQSTALHKTVEDVEIKAARLVPDEETNEDPTEKEFKKDIVGHSFASTRRHGKWLFVALEGEGNRSIVFHFGMTGGLKYFKDMDDEPEYARVLFHFENGYQLAYLSKRKLGELEVISSVDKFIKEKDLGPDALDPDFDLAAFKKAVADRHAMVKTTLMDQEIMAGIGNVYSDEILYKAGIYPRTEIDTLDEDELTELFHTMKKVLKTAIKYDAKPDQFPDSYLTPHRHEGGHCPKCDAELKRVQVGSRHAYYCPNRQKKKS